MLPKMSPPQAAQSMPALLSLLRLTSAIMPRSSTCFGCVSSCSRMVLRELNCSCVAVNTRLFVGRSGTTVEGIAPLGSGDSFAATESICESCSATVFASAFFSR